MLAGLAFGSEIKNVSGRSRMTRAAIVVLMLLAAGVWGAVPVGILGSPSATRTRCPWHWSTSDRGAVRFPGSSFNAGAEIAKSLNRRRRPGLARGEAPRRHEAE